MAVGWPLLALYGAFAPRASDMLALRKDSTEIQVLVGIAGGSRECVDNNPCVATEPPQRSYIVFPRVFVNGAVTLVEDTGEGTVAREIAGLAPVPFFVWGMCLFGTWYFWIRTGI